MIYTVGSLTTNNKTERIIPGKIHTFPTEEISTIQREGGGECLDMFRREGKHVDVNLSKALHLLHSQLWMFEGWWEIQNQDVLGKGGQIPVGSRIGGEDIFNFLHVGYRSFQELLILMFQPKALCVLLTALPTMAVLGITSSYQIQPI